MTDMPSLFEIDYARAATVCLELGTKMSLPAQCIGGSKTSWQFNQGFDDYSRHKPMRQAYLTCVLEESRVMYRLGWLSALFLDLQNREQIIMSREEEGGK